MNTARIHLLGMTRKDLDESVRALQGLLNGVVGADELTQTVEFGLPEPGKRSGWIISGTLTTNISTQKRRS